MEIETPRCRLRPWRPEDKTDLLCHADNPKVAQNLSDVFPSPYTEADADGWLKARAADEGSCTEFAIEIDGEVVGGIGVVSRNDVLSRTPAVGYWLSESFWGKGYMTEVLRAFVPYAFTATDCHRLESWHYGWNPGSGRVLEKAGFQLEGCLRERFCKNGEYTDGLMYGLLRDEAM